MCDSGEAESSKGEHGGGADTLATMAQALKAVAAGAAKSGAGMPEASQSDEAEARAVRPGQRLNRRQMPTASQAAGVSNECTPGPSGPSPVRWKRPWGNCVTAPSASTPGPVSASCWDTRRGAVPIPATPGRRSAVASRFVNNAFMLADVEKTALRAPFAPAPRGLFTGCPSLSLKPPYFERVTRFTTAPRRAALRPPARRPRLRPARVSRRPGRRNVGCRPVIRCAEWLLLRKHR